VLCANRVESLGFLGTRTNRKVWVGPFDALADGSGLLVLNAGLSIRAFLGMSFEGLGRVCVLQPKLDDSVYICLHFITNKVNQTIDTYMWHICGRLAEFSQLCSQ
jgi:hypothetical protein